MWIPLEANPEVMNTFATKLLPTNTKFEFMDVFGFDEELLAMIPQPIKSLILLFPVTEAYEEFRRNEETTVVQPTPPDSLYFIKQTIPNACGTIGLLHSLINGILVNKATTSELLEGPLTDLFISTRDLSPAEKATVLEKNELLAYAHKECSSAGQSAIPGDDEEANLHFVAFVEMQGKLWELDGRKPGPVCHGECTDLLMGSVKVVKEFMQRDPEQLHFTAIALAPVGED